MASCGLLFTHDRDPPAFDFAVWLRKLKHRQALTHIAIRLVRLQSGLMGDVKYFGGIGEIRIDYRPGYRLYFVKRGETIVVLLCSGDKATQDRVIRRAMDLAKAL